MRVGPIRSRLRCWAIQAQAAPELALLSLGPLGVHEHAEAVLEAERGELGIAELSA